jgi:hypothetical protein
MAGHHLPKEQQLRSKAEILARILELTGLGGFTPPPGREPIIQELAAALTEVNRLVYQLRSAGEDVIDGLDLPQDSILQRMGLTAMLAGIFVSLGAGPLARNELESLFMQAENTSQYYVLQQLEELSPLFDQYFRD